MSVIKTYEYIFILTYSVCVCDSDEISDQACSDSKVVTRRVRGKKTSYVSIRFCCCYKFKLLILMLALDLDSWVVVVNTNNSKQFRKNAHLSDLT